MHLMKMKTLFSFLEASPQVPLGLKYFDNIFLRIFDRKKGLILLLQHAAYENGHYLMINNPINVSKLHIIRKNRDCTFRSYTL